MVKLYELAAVGVSEMVAELDKVAPAGGEPALSVQV
jgi:hypothetical protein